jgi:hypothetical protein
MPSRWGDGFPLCPRQSGVARTHRRGNHRLNLPVDVRLCACHLLWGNPANHLCLSQLVIGRDALTLCRGELAVSVNACRVSAVSASDFVNHIDHIPSWIGDGVHLFDGGGKSSGHDFPFRLRVGCFVCVKLCFQCLYCF